MNIHKHILIQTRVLSKLPNVFLPKNTPQNKNVLQMDTLLSKSTIAEFHKNLFSLLITITKLYYNPVQSIQQKDFLNIYI